ncbi:MAG: hypothetical protein D6702_00220 [Planctomycetota bacterium]|nr:MAG: hypothetical protein D6702_00220 [Planctomycetota bacterium]
MAETPLDRRAFFRRSARTLLDAVAESVRTACRADRGRTDGPLRRLRPPGAVAEEDFLRRCTACDDCLTACPAACIVRVPPGRPDAGTPVIRPDRRACVLCADFACAAACGAGALQTPTTPAAAGIGTARLEPALCLSWTGATCDTCVAVCPVEPKAVEFDLERHPVVAADRCPGCGLCEERCPALPRAIRIEPPFGRPVA